ncbi:hypothetical protein Tco_1525129 [Tanacetum coccineum]
MGDEHFNTIPETEKSSVENLVPITSEFKGISEDICDVPSCDYFDAECELINSLLSRDISITSPKIDFLPEKFDGELNLILPGINEDDFDKEGEIDIDILQIENEILREKLLNINLVVDKIEALKLTPSIPFALENPSSSPIPVVNNDFLKEEVDTFLVLEDSIPPSIESDLDSEEDIIFLNNLLNDDPIPEYERFTFNIEPDAPMINNFDELNEEECFDLGGEPIRGFNGANKIGPLCLKEPIWVFDMNGALLKDDEFILFGAFSDRNASCSMIPNGYGNNESQNILGTDIKEMDKIKAKTDKHEHGNGMSAQEPEVFSKEQTPLLRVTRKACAPLKDATLAIRHITRKIKRLRLKVIDEIADAKVGICSLGYTQQTTHRRNTPKPHGLSINRKGMSSVEDI